MNANRIVGNNASVNGYDVPKNVRDIKDKLERVAEGIAEAKYAESFKSEYTLAECIEFCKKNRAEHPEVAGFIVTVQRNLDPRNENDMFIIVQGLLNAAKKPISVDGGITALTQTVHTKTIDAKLARFLDGAESKICMFSE